MTFEIPNLASATFPAQAEPDSGDFVILAAGPGGTGVQAGCAVTAQGVPDMTLAVAAGTIAVAGVAVAVAAGNVAVSAADATNPRFDLVVVSNAGVKSVTAGAPAASPVFPAIPANSVVLAAVYVSAAIAAIAANRVIDKRVVVTASGGGAGAASGAKLIIVAAQSITASPSLATPYVLTWDSEEWDTDGYHDLVTNPPRITVPAGLGGKVRLEGFAWTTTTWNSGQFGTVRIRKNGATYLRGRWEKNYAPAVMANGAGASAVDSAVAGDWYELCVTQADTSLRSLDATLCTFSIERLGS